MTIAFVADRPSHYRTPIFLRLAERLHVDFIFTATKPGRWWTTDHDACDSGLRASYPSAYRLYRLLRARPYSAVVLSLSGRTHLAATAAAVARSGHPLVLWVDMWFYPQTMLHAAGRPLVRYLLRRADTIVSCGPHITQWIHEEVGRSSGIVEMPNAVENERFRKPVAREDVRSMRESLGLTEVTGCFVGRLEKEKGLDALLHAVALSSTSFELVIVGTGSLHDWLVKLSGSLGLADRVRFVGWVEQDDLPVLYQACDFLVLPSVSTRLVKETWGVAVNEAMNAGLPVVTTDAVGAAAGGLVIDGVTGWVVPEGEERALAQALDLAAANSELRTRLGTAARSAVSGYTFEACTDAFERAVQFAVARRPGAQTPHPWQ